MRLTIEIHHSMNDELQPHNFHRNSHPKHLLLDDRFQIHHDWLDQILVHINNDSFETIWKMKYPKDTNAIKINDDFKVDGTLT